MSGKGQLINELTEVRAELAEVKALLRPVAEKAHRYKEELAEAKKTIYKRNGENVNLMAERDRQRETMEWYGDEENYLLHYAPETHYPIFDDGGKRARDALEGGR